MQSHTLVDSPCKTHLNYKDKLSLQLGDNALQPQIDCLSP